MPNLLMMTSSFNRISLICLVVAWGVFGCQKPRVSDNVVSSSEQAQENSPSLQQVCCGGQDTETIDSSQDRLGIFSQNFGTIGQGDIIEVTFPLENQGDTKAQLTDEITSSYPCCVEVTVLDDILEPGQSTEVTIELDSELRPGPIDIFIDLPYKGGEVVEKLHLGGVVKPEFVVRPTGLRFVGNETIEFEVTGEGLFQEFQVLGIENEVEGLEVKEIRRDDERIIYQANWNGPLGESELKDIYVVSNHSKVERYPIVIAPPAADV
jgi:hypothetical protein